MTSPWRMLPLWSVATAGREVVEPTDLGDEVVHYSIPSVDATGTGQVEKSESIKSAKLRLTGGEVLISKLNPRKSRVLSVAASSLPIVSSTEFVGLRAGSALDSRYLAYLLQSDFIRQELDARVQSVTRSHQRVAPEDITHLHVAVAPVPEQRRIADFLDGETARIDRLAHLRSRQAHLLEERFGLALDNAFKNAAYEPTRLKYLLAVKPRYGVLVPQFSDSGVRFIRVNDLLDLAGRADSLAKIPDDLSSQYARTVTRPGDVLLSVVGTMGRSAVVPPQLAGANMARAVASLRTRRGVSPELLATWLTTPSFLRQASDVTGSDTAQPTLGMEDLSNFRLSWPVDERGRDELLRITSTIRRHQRKLTELLEAQRRVLAERRQALITAAVTGQFDVSTASGRNVTDGVSA
ncbi:restriction endonuclease subunit S [Streptomyces sp. FXY-T5]|uniref:restriction endonuclease subunit S n=1 Tax=Streptomyces sp. FXY-T5 TaxID=3064901 RepID=UPI0027D25CE3|nr:restriction endonuclease subunit S [Streptomyces sp. FXY-T5]WMD09322.1 restriction endonuclease subunit S [Streptomyces sp. FXY-T5]